MINSRIAVIGGGSWATAIVKILLNNNEKVGWWMRNKESVEFIKKFKHNPHYLSSVEFDVKKLDVQYDLKSMVKNFDVLVMVVPAAFLEDALKQITKEDLKNKLIFSAIKGIVPDGNLIIGDFFNTKF